MATIINSISFENFYNYYGSYENNTYRFKPGINIISADNNMGKSKFYNGLLWILQNQVYDSDTKSLVSADDSLIKMASGKAKVEEDSFEMGTKIMFTSDYVTYTMTKHVRFQKRNDVLSHNDSVLDILVSKDGEDRFIVDSVEKKEIIDKVFIPLALRPYALLQGESMDRLVDLSSKKALAQTIDTLAGISSLKDVSDLAVKLARDANMLYQQKDSESSQNDSALTRDKSLKFQKQEKIDNIKEDIEHANEELSQAKDIKEGLDAYIGNSSKRIEIRGRLYKTESQIEAVTKRKSDLESSITSKLFDEDCPWLLMGLDKELDEFGMRREKYIGEIAKMNEGNGALVIMLPEGSPDTSSLERMLKNEVCEVCGQPAHRGSSAWNHIKMILERPKKVSTTRNDFGQFYGMLQKSASSYSMSIPKIPARIQALNDDIDSATDRLESLSEEREDVLTELNNAGGNATNSEFNDQERKSKYDWATSTITSKERDINDLQHALNTLEDQLRVLTERIGKYSQNVETKKYQDFADTMSFISMVIADTKEQIYTRTINSLQEEANKKYTALTTGNLTSGGRLEFRKERDTVNVTIRDVNNGEITGLGTGFQRMKQLAIVMAVISSKIGDEKKFDYPFISDAPFSEFGENFITNFFNVAPEVFTQSIIMIKELYDPNAKDLMTALGRKILNRMREGSMPGTFYVNTIENKADTTGLVTSHKCYKD